MLRYLLPFSPSRLYDRRMYVGHWPLCPARDRHRTILKRGLGRRCQQRLPNFKTGCSDNSIFILAILEFSWTSIQRQTAESSSKTSSLLKRGMFSISHVFSPRFGTWRPSPPSKVNPRCNMSAPSRRPQARYDFEAYCVLQGLSSYQILQRRVPTRFRPRQTSWSI